MANKILHECMKRGFLLDREMLEMISNLNEEGAQGVIHAISRLGLKERVVNKKVFTENFDAIQRQLVKFSGDDMLMSFFSGMGFIDKKQRHNDVQDDDEKVVGKGKVKLVSAPAFPQRKICVNDFVRHFKSRYEVIQGVLEKQEFQDLSSIRRIGQNNGTYTIIAAVVEKRITKNKNIMIKVEDLTGSVNVLINNSNPDLYDIADKLLLDDIVAFSVNGTNELLFVSEIVFPEAYLDEKRYGDDDCWVAFVSDLHVGSRMFLEKNFLKFIKWLNGGEGSESQKKIAKNVRYLFVAGDIIDGVNYSPGQEAYLNIDTTTGQYKKVEEMMKLFRDDLQIVMCPGQHDAVWIGEPQPRIDEEWAPGLHKIPNLHLVPNPSMTSIDSNFKILMYHGASINSLIDKISEIRVGVGHNSPTTVVKEMVRRRHLAPMHGSVDYIPCEEDPMVIGPVPDIIFTGNKHRSEVSTFNNILLVSGSCFQSVTPFDEKIGNDSEPCRVPLFNLKTREVKIIDFSGEDVEVSEEEVPEVEEVKNEE